VFDIVTGYFPETKPEAGGAKLRPLLVTKVLRNKQNGSFACEVAYGTSNLKVGQRLLDDIIIQNFNDLNELNLYQATRFVLRKSARVVMPWSSEYFGCWTGHLTPRLSTLLVDYQKDYAFSMMRQMGSNGG
jgi:hypothetical protein